MISLCFTHATRGLSVGVCGCFGQSPTTPAACILVLGVHLSGLWCQNPTVFGVVSKKPIVRLGFPLGIVVSCLWGTLLVILMSNPNDKKPVVVLKVVLMMSKITEHKLNGLNYLEWSKTIRLYVRSIHMVAHLTKEPPTDDSKEQWI